jgi:hypothetical protein
MTMTNNIMHIKKTSLEYERKEYNFFFLGKKQKVCIHQGTMMKRRVA